MPTVSVIMPAFNAAQTIEASILSVIGQSHDDWELVIVDDGSNDETREIASRLSAMDSRISVIGIASNGGVARARNLGLEAARGRFIAFLDADDVWLPDKLHTQVRFHATTAADFSYMTYRHMTLSGVPGKLVSSPLSVSHAGLLKGNVIGTLTAMLGRDLLGQHRFPLRGHEDYALWLTLLRQIPLAMRVGGDSPYALYRLNRQSLSGCKLRALGWQWRIYREQEQLGCLTSARYLATHAARGLVKHYW